MQTGVSVIISLFFLVWLSGVTGYLYANYRKYKRLSHGLEREDLASLLNKISDRLAENEKSIAEITKEITRINFTSRFMIQKVGLVRFNPFADTGGDQSFVLAVLDGEDSGIVLSSLHGRGVTRWYAKNIRQGKGVSYELSKEEVEAIKKAEGVKKI